MEPLRWPVWYMEAGRIERFCCDVPFIGLNARCKRHLNHQLAMREASQCEQEWADYPVERELSFMVSPILAVWMRWCNELYIPADPCAILLWDPNVFLDATQATVEVAERFSVVAEVFEGVERLAYVDLLRRIREHGSRPARSSVDTT